MDDTKNRQAAAEAVLIEKMTARIAGAGADGLTSFSVLRGRPGTTAWSSMQFTEQQIGQVVFLTREDALAALGGDLT